jgi:hypothetical protein
MKNTMNIARSFETISVDNASLELKDLKGACTKLFFSTAQIGVVTMAL